MSSISAGLSDGTALVSTGDTTGELVLKTNGGTTAVTIGTNQNVTLAAGLTTTSPTVFPAGTASAPAITTTGDTNTGIFFPAADTIGFTEGGAEAMRIDSSGNVGIGTSSPAVKAQIQTTDATTNAVTTVLRLAHATSGTQANGIGVGVDFAPQGNAGSLDVIGRIEGVFTDVNNNIGYIGFQTRNSGGGLTEKMRIDSAGALILAGSTAQKATGTTWSNPSDERLKDNIRDYNKGLAELMQVRVREWEYNGKGGTVEGTKGLGVVADEVMDVLPDTVDNYEAKLNADDEEVTAIKKFDATEITWLLVKTVQELKAENDSLKARIEALETGA